MSHEQQLEYLRNVLALDPASRSESILAAREQRRASKQATATPSSGPALFQGPSHQQLAAELARVGQSFFETPAARVSDELAALPLARFADLEHAAARLLRVNTLRDKLDKLAADPSVDADLARTLRELLVAPPGGGASLRSASVQAARQRRGAKAARRFVEALNTRYPELAELERPWLQHLLDARRNALDARKPGVGCLVIGWVVLMALAGVGQFLEWLNS